MTERVLEIYDLINLDINLVMSKVGEFQGVDLDCSFAVIRHGWLTLHKLVARRTIHADKEVAEKEKKWKTEKEGVKRKENDKEHKKQKADENIARETGRENLEKKVYTEVARCIWRLDLEFYIRAEH